MESKSDNNTSVYSLTSRIVHDLYSRLDTSSGKAQLANLRNSIGKPLSQTIEVWPIIFEYLPEEYISKYKYPSNYEKAILTSLQLFALYQQGNSEKTILEDEDGYWKNIGYSLSFLRDETEGQSFDNRFNAMITSSTYEELTYLLRQLIKLLKSKTLAKINYGKLAEDLFWFLQGNQEKVRLRWARTYYSNTRSNKGENTNENK